MKPNRIPAALLLAFTFIMPTHAGEPDPLFDGCKWWFPNLRQEWQARHCWCPNDYCIKPQPCVRPNQAGCVDDYCTKPMPCVTPNARGCVDDYCPKCCPLYLGKLCQPWYSCGSGDKCNNCVHP